MTEVDPPRLGDDAHGGALGAAPAGSLSHALRAARRHTPSPAELRSLAAALPLALPPAAAAPTGVTSALPLKIGAGVAIVAVVVVGAMALLRRAPLAESAPPASSGIVADERLAGSVSAVETVQAEPPPSAPRAADPEASPSASSPATARVLAAPSTPPKAADGPTEAALLLSAKSALAVNPERALALTEEHKRRFPAGKLAQEREVIAIAALQKLGRSGAAKAESDRFKEEHPGSIHQQGSAPSTGH
ncbi:MAG: hypothetical protein U0414_20295 [Polyangiaceae bacterium]